MKLTRRVVAVAGVAALAGCLSDGDDEPAELGGDEPEESDSVADPTEPFELAGEDILPVPVAGDPNADVTVTVFEDFGCSGCQHYKQNLYPEIKSAYIDENAIRYEHRDFPIPAHPEWSWAVASAARSVQEHYDDDGFFAFSTAIYEELPDYSYDVIESVADDQDLDGETIRTAAEDEPFREDLEAERDRAEAAGVGQTPTIVVDGEVIDHDRELVLEAIDAALE